MTLGLSTRPTLAEVDAAQAEADRLHAECVAFCTSCTPAELSARVGTVQAMQTRADEAADCYRRIAVAYRELGPRRLAAQEAR
jgi:hypothetical protein